MYKLKFILILIVVQFSNSLFAQEKFEKESRIQQKEVPASALKFIESTGLTDKIKWYKEEGLSNNSFEGKFKFNNSKYSVEFDTLGNLEDIEMEVLWNYLEASIKDSISLHLKKDCLKHKIIKVQKQYTGSDSALLSALKSDYNNQSLKIQYEIIVKCKQQNNTELFEYLFNDTGKPISISKIVFKNSSHLEY